MSSLVAVGRAMLIFVLFAGFAGLSFSIAAELMPMLKVATRGHPAPVAPAGRPEARGAIVGSGATAANPTAIGLDEAQYLAGRDLVIPVEGITRERLRDNFDEGRGKRRHEALDIMAPRGTPVLAVDDGRVAKLFRSAAGGITVYQLDPEERFVYYYAHLDRYAEGLKEGDTLRKGAVVGYVGSTGNAPANAPHLHFSIFRMGPEKRWWKGTALNPYPYLTASR